MELLISRGRSSAASICFFSGSEHGASRVQKLDGFRTNESRLQGSQFVGESRSFATANVDGGLRKKKRLVDVVGGSRALLFLHDAPGMRRLPACRSKFLTMFYADKRSLDRNRTLRVHTRRDGDEQFDARRFFSASRRRRSDLQHFFFSPSSSSSHPLLFTLSPPQPPPEPHRRLSRPGAQASHLHQPHHHLPLPPDRRGQRQDLPRMHQARHPPPRDEDLGLQGADGDSYGPRRAQGQAQEGAQGPVHQDAVQEVEGDIFLLFERAAL